MDISYIDRRKFLKASATATVVALMGRKAFANTVGANTRFDLSDPATTLAKGVTMAVNGERLQSAAFGHQNKMFTIQQPSGGTTTGALVLSYNMWDPTNDTIQNWNSSHGKMTLSDFGHGQNFGVTFDGTDHWIWIECNAPQGTGGTAFGTMICRFRWKEGDNGTYSTSDIGTTSTKLPGSYLYTQLQPGATNMSCSVDTISNTLMLRFKWNDANNPPNGGVSYTGPYNIAQYAVYDLNTLTASGAYHALPLRACFQAGGFPTISDGQGGTESSTPQQGFTFMQNFIYQIYGFGNGSNCSPGPDKGNVCISSFDTRTADRCEFTHITGGQDLNEHEPEGIWVQRTGTGQRLVFCLTSSASCNGGVHSGAQLSNFYYKDLETDDAFTSCPIS